MRDYRYFHHWSYESAMPRKKEVHPKIQSVMLSNDE